MLSSDKNVETIGQLIEVLKHYIGLQREYVKLDVIEKIVRLITAMALFAVFFLIVIIMIIYLSFALAYALAAKLGMVGAFCLVAGIYFVALLLLILFRKKWIERPLVQFLATLLLEK